VLTRFLYANRYPLRSKPLRVFSPGIWWREGRYLLLPRDETISNAALNLLVGVAEAQVLGQEVLQQS